MVGDRRQAGSRNRVNASG